MQEKNIILFVASDLLFNDKSLEELRKAIKKHIKNKRFSYMYHKYHIIKYYLGNISIESSSIESRDLDNSFSYITKDLISSGYICINLETLKKFLSI